jgi:DNA polymerase-1
MSKRFVLVDGNALLHAAWHGYPERIGSDGLSYRGVQGFLSKIHRMDRDYEWDELLVVFDPVEGSLYRKNLFAGYKAHRPESDPDLVRQLELMPRILNDFGFKTLTVPGVESDDVIGTLAKKRAGMGELVMIVTPDKDMAQLVNEEVGLLRPLRGSAAMEVPFDYIGPDGVYEKFGVRPSQVADWLALIGDVSDNIPGVKGVGPKTATKLIEKYGDVRTVVTNAGSIKGNIGEALKEFQATVDVVLKLTTIQTDLDVSDWVISSSEGSSVCAQQWREIASFPNWMGVFNFNAQLTNELGNFSNSNVLSTDSSPFCD